MSVTLLIALVIFSYLLGNISWARIISRRRNVDITKQGSGNPGATNTLRTLGGKAGVAVFLLDIAKGAIPALIAVFVFGGYVKSDAPLVLMGTNESYLALYLCGLAAVLGHALPVIYKFKGGKGIATMFGVFIVAQPLLALITFLVCFILVLFVKYMSAMSILFITTLVVLQMIFMPEGSSAFLYVVLSAFLVILFVGHRSNIMRLYRGQENKTDLMKYIKKIFKKSDTKDNKAKSEILSNSQDNVVEMKEESASELSSSESNTETNDKKSENGQN